MKAFDIARKSFKEHLRSKLILLLTLAMGPFFIFVYFLITQSSTPSYTLLLLNTDRGVQIGNAEINHGNQLLKFFTQQRPDTFPYPFLVRKVRNAQEGLLLLNEKKADALLTIPATFSRELEARKNKDSLALPQLEITGDLLSVKYLVSAIWANEFTTAYTVKATNGSRLFTVKETALGTSGSVTEFDLLVPGLLIISVIMLMFTASIAFVSEVENKTILRLKLSGVSALDYLAGTGSIQVLIGLLSVAFTLFTAIGLGFRQEGSWLVLFVIAGFTSLSIIAFSLLIAAVTKSASEVLVVGNFPMFLFMFFTGAAFPLKSDSLFSIAGYPVTFQSLLSPTHAISALNKTLIMKMDAASVLPEMTALLLLTLVYFFAGAVLFKRRHLKQV